MLPQVSNLSMLKEWNLVMLRVWIHILALTHFPAQLAIRSQSDTIDTV